MLLHHRHGEAVLDGLGGRVCLGQFLRRTLQVRTRLFDLLLQLLVIAVQLFVVRQRRVVDAVVLLPGITRRPLHADPKPVVLEKARESSGQAALGYQRLHCRLHLRTQTLNRFLTRISAHLSREHLVNRVEHRIAKVNTTPLN